MGEGVGGFGEEHLFVALDVCFEPVDDGQYFGELLKPRGVVGGDVWGVHGFVFLSSGLR